MLFYVVQRSEKSAFEVNMDMYFPVHLLFLYLLLLDEVGSFYTEIFMHIVVLS